MTTPIDYTPLFLPVSKEEIALFRRESRQKREPWAGNAVTTVVVVVVGTLAGLWVILALIGLTSASISFTGSPGSLIGGVLPVVVMVVVMVAILGVASVLGVRAWAGRWEGLLRRNRFAAANGLVYVHEVTAPDYPGVIFGIGNGRRTTGSYRRVTGSELDMGGYRYTTGSGKNKSTYTWGYVALRLPRRLPHMVLDARGNNGLFSTSSLPLSFSRDQVLSLEGDFDKYFTLYCPRMYERDALYVFTPDLMALLIDESAAFDVEIIDDWMFLYSRGGLAIDQPAIIQRLFRIIDTVGAKARNQTEWYADERIGDRGVDLVAPRGQRLKRGYGTAGVITFAIAAAWVAFTVLQRISY